MITSTRIIQDRVTSTMRHTSEISSHSNAPCNDQQSLHAVCNGFKQRHEISKFHHCVALPKDWHKNCAVSPYTAVHDIAMSCVRFCTNVSVASLESTANMSTTCTQMQIPKFLTRIQAKGSTINIRKNCCCCCCITNLKSCHSEILHNLSSCVWISAPFGVIIVSIQRLDIIRVSVGQLSTWTSS